MGPPVTTPASAPGRCSALKSALQVASAGLLPVPPGALYQEEAGDGRTPGHLQAPAGAGSPEFVKNVLVVRGQVPWRSLHSGLGLLEPFLSGRWTIEDVCITDLVSRPSWDGELGFAGRQDALEAGRSILQKKPSLLLIAPGFRAAGSEASRSAAWPRGRVELSKTRRAALHLEDLCWAAIGGLLDAVLEAAAEGLPSPAFVLFLSEAFATAGGRARVEPLFEARLDTLARLPGVITGAFHQCAWAEHEAATEPQRLIANVTALRAHIFVGLPTLREKPGARGERRRSYFGPLPGSCSCGRQHKRRSSEEAAVAEPLEPGVSGRLSELLGTVIADEAAGPTALAGGEVAAFTLLSGPPAEDRQSRQQRRVPEEAGDPSTCTSVEIVGWETPSGVTPLRSAETGMLPGAAGFSRRISGRTRCGALS